MACGNLWSEVFILVVSLRKKHHSVLFSCLEENSAWIVVFCSLTRPNRLFHPSLDKQTYCWHYFILRLVVCKQMKALLCAFKHLLYCRVTGFREKVICIKI